MTVTYKHPRPIRALRDRENGDGPGPGSGKAEPNSDPVPDTDERGTVLVCRGCRSKITRTDLSMSVDGSHRHVFFNPRGDVFEIGCFASAKNLVPTGPKTDEFTWFPGHMWQVVVCTGCRSQLGWRYIGNNGGFFGLILANLMEEFDT